jgi:hypothetical protein
MYVSPALLASTASSRMAASSRGISVAHSGAVPCKPSGKAVDEWRYHKGQQVDPDKGVTAQNQTQRMSMHGSGTAIYLIASLLPPGPP